MYLSHLLKYGKAPIAIPVGVFQGVQAAIAQAGDELGYGQLGRDIAAMPEAFMGSPGALRPVGGDLPSSRARVEPTFGRPGEPSEPAGLLPGPETPGGPRPGAPGAPARPAPPRLISFEDAMEGAPPDSAPPPETPPATPTPTEAPATAAQPPSELLNTSATAPPRPEVAAPPVSPGPELAPASEATPSVESAPPSPAEPGPAPVPTAAHGGPWTDTGKKNHLGDAIWENPNGTRAIMESGVPWTESVRMDPDKGMVPRNPGDRKKQFLTTDEEFGDKLKPAPEKPKAEWTLLGTNADGLPVYANPQGVHSVVDGGVRDVEFVRLRPTRNGMAMEVPGPGDKDPRYRVVKKADEPKAESPPKVGQPPETPPAVTKAAEPPTAMHARKIDMQPDDLIYREIMQSRLDQTRELFPEGEGYHPIVAVKTSQGFEIIDGHNRTEVAKERGDAIPVVVIPQQQYESLLKRGFDDMEIAYAALDLAGEGDAAESINQQFPGARILQRGMEAANVISETPPEKPRAATKPPAAATPAASPPSAEAAMPQWQKQHPEVPKTTFRGSGRADQSSVYNPLSAALPVLGPGRYAAFTEEAAKVYGPTVEKGATDLKNPIVIRSDQQWKALAKEAGWKYPNPTGLPKDQVEKETAKLRALVQSKGHDGIVVYWDDSSSSDIDKHGNDIKTLRNVFGDPQMVNYRAPTVAATPPASEEKPTAGAPKPTEHPGLVITSLETGKTTKIQPIGTVPPAQAAETPTAAPEPPPAADKPQIVTHVTKKGKTLTGVIRKDLDRDGAKAIDKYTFRKDGGWFIRTKPEEKPEYAEAPSTVEKKPTPKSFWSYQADTPPGPPSHMTVDQWEALSPGMRREIFRSQPELWKPSESGAEPPPITLPDVAQQSGDQTPPAHLPPPPPDPTVAEAIDNSRGRGPAPVTEPEPTDKIRRTPREITEDDIGRGMSMLEDTEQWPQVDTVLDMLTNGWSPVDISETPGIDLTPHEVMALGKAEEQDAEDRDLPPPRRGSDDGIQESLFARDAGAGPEDVPGPDTDGQDGGTSPAEEPRSPRTPGSATRPSAPRQTRGGRSGGSSGGRGTRTRNPDRVPDAGEGPETGDAGRPPQERADDSVEGVNYVIEPGALAEERGRAQKARDNVAAIELAKRLKAEGAVATRSEQEILAKYVGWGGLKNAFRDSEGKFGTGMEAIGQRLQEILTPDEYRTAERSTQYAHYTAEHVIRSMWDAVKGMGFEGGSVFEPGMGIGHFLGLMPPDLAEKSRYRGIEMDHLTADIAKLLYPQSGVKQADFTRMPLPEEEFDLVIGNPPFSDAVVSTDRKYAPRRFMLHDYFFAKSLDAVRPGGLLAFVTSAGTMNKMESKAREYLAERGQFLGGVRLPSSAFRQNAGTEVTTDILFFKRRPEGRVPLATLPPEETTWTQLVQRELPNAEGEAITGNVNRYFSQHPEMVLGQEGYFDKLYKDRYAVHQVPGTDLPTDLRVAVDRLPKGVMEPAPTPEQRAIRDLDATEKKDGSFYVKDGRLMQYRGGAGREVQSRGKGVEGGLSTADRDRIVKLIPVRDALRDVFKADLARDTAAGQKARAALNKAYDSFVSFFGPINKAEFTFKRPSIIQQETAREEAREEARFVGDPWNEGDFDATPMLDAKAKLGDIARARAQAREAAQVAGKPFNEGTFDPSDMEDVIIEKRPNIKPFMSDPESYRLRSIEDYNDASGAAAKKPIFSRNILSFEEEPELRSAHDGVLWSFNKLGRFDLPAIAEKMGRPVADLVTDLGDDVFKVPGTDDAYQTKDEYLSGDVVTKLEQAMEAVKEDPSLERNVAALKAGQPVPLSPGRITMILGMPWVPPDVIAEFAREKLQLGNTGISYSPELGQWFVTPPRQRADAAGLLQWSTPSRDAYKLLSDGLNRTPPRIMTAGSRDDPPRFDPTATQAAREKMQQMIDTFFNMKTRNGWAIEDNDRGYRLASIYNSTMNREIRRQFDGSYLKTPGVAATWSWRPHQTRVVSRIILMGNTYMAHAVGAGKTSGMIGAGMEMKRLGLVKKPMYVVPNHMLGQFTKEFYEQYPTARIMVADEDRFHTDRRKQFIANVAQDDLDAVIITHSGFQKVPISDEFGADLIRAEIEMLVDAINSLDKKGDRITVGRLQKQKEKLEQRLSKSQGTDKDQTLTFEEMGVDFLFVDEAHQFRKLSFATKQGQLKGVSPEGSNMSWDLFTKVRYLDQQQPGRSVVFASGTPITNTMGELYTLSRFMQPEALQARGLSHFDSWAQAFGTTKVGLEQTAAGTYSPQTRFGQFVNLPELYKMVSNVMDIVTPAQLEQYVTRPQLKDGKRTQHMAPRTEILDRFQDQLAQRMDAIKARRGPPAKGDDILLSVINDGRHGAIDPRFIEVAQNDPNSKLNLMIANVAKIYHETGDVQFYDPGSGYTKPSFRGPATQMIFANLGVNGRGPMGFSGYQWIKEGLRRAGVPADQIAFIGDYEGTLARQRLFNDMNEGKVRVLVGSTQKMGTGVNAQRRLIAVHNQDPLWYPADDEQRNGRIMRQGNHNREIQIHDYTTTGTYDSQMWSMMGRKAGFIEQFFRGDPELRDMEDLGEASMYEQAAAMSTRDPRILTLTEMQQDLDKAKRRKDAHRDEQWSLRNKQSYHNSSANSEDREADRLADDIAQRKDTRGDKFSAVINGETYTKRKDANAALYDVIKERLPGMDKKGNATTVVGKIGGFPIRLQATKYGYYLTLRMTNDRGRDLSTIDPISSAEGSLRQLESDRERAIKEAEFQRMEAAKVTPYLGTRFDGDEEIERLEDEIAALEAILEGEAKAADARTRGAQPTQQDDDDDSGNATPPDRDLVPELDIDEAQDVQPPKLTGRDVDLGDGDE